MFNKLAHSFVIGSCLMHMFCCGLPIILAISGLGAIIGISGGEFFEFAWFETNETTILIASGIILLVTGVIQAISYYIDCRKGGSCQHEPCESKKNISGRIFKFAAALYLVNIFITIYS